MTVILNGLLESIGNLLRWLSNMFGFSNSQNVENGLEVFVKTNRGEQVSVRLNSKWTIAQVKGELAPKLGTKFQDLRIIFAGKELTDDIVIESCDLGNNSVLHAVRVEAKPAMETGATTSIKSANIKLQDLNLSVRPSAENSATATCFVSPSSELPNDAQMSSSSITNISQGCCDSRLLCDASMVITIQMNEAEQQLIRDLKNLSFEEQERPQFFVFCSHPCAAIKVGKLRVRCATCHEGALTLQRDPGSWQDVLMARQVMATCEKKDCQGTYAEFFFKCRDHVTSGEEDTAVPLYLVRSNIRAVPCLACADVSSPVVVFECQSQHTVCLDCFITFGISRLNERQFIYDDTHGYTLPCPVGCPDSLVREGHHFRLLGEHHYQRYQHFGTEEAVLAAGGVLCPFPGCGQGLLVDPECRRVMCPMPPGCGYVFCAHCHQGYHVGECQTEVWQSGESATILPMLALDQERADRSRWEDGSSALAIQMLTKPCPKCRTPTERDGGCMHMVCARAVCSFHWCWVCQTEWSRECMAAHWFG